MSAAAIVEGTENVPDKPMLVLPNRVDAGAVEALEELLGGNSKIVWMVEHSLRPAPEISKLLEKRGASGFFISMHHMSRETLHEYLQKAYHAGRHVVLLPGRTEQPHASMADTPLPLLSYLLTDYTLHALPIYIGMYNLKQPPLITDHTPCESLRVRALAPVRPGADMAAEVYAAWMGASVAQAAPLLGEQPTLPHALLRSMLAHPQAKIIDGVDDTQMTYRQLLVRAAMLARQLRRHVANKRIGIILPPGKFSIIANVACLLAGITPVNIDYTYDSAAFESVALQAELSRLITEHRFIQMQEDFPWPLTRDILFIDDVPDTTGTPLSWGVLARWITHGRIAKWIQVPEISPEDEALVVFSPSGEGMPVHGHALSHSTLLAGAALCHSRFRVGAGQRVLSALPYHYQAGLLAGLVQPLLLGQDIITYPLPGDTVGTCKRLCTLARQYQAAMAVFTPEQATAVLAQAAEGDFAATTCLHVVGKAPAEAVQLAHTKHHVHLSECYLPPGCAMPIACSTPTAPPTAADASTPASLVGDALGTTGQLLPGVAVRITDLENRHRTLPPTAQGIVWVKGPGLNLEPIGEASHSQPAHERWHCTGDVGFLREDGMLVVKGPGTRFTKISGEIIFHEEVEQLMLRFLRVKELTPPPLAVVGLPDPKTGQEQLILLSTIHKVVGPHDVITLRYDITNAHLSPLKAPSRIIAMRSIPTLPGGQVNYAYCRALAQRVIGSSS